ncbi:hypothetical protein GCM10017559_65140 [Streptosporangium longisporum]|uniref:Uncharacterized protein n=1 Tax=Streptosporangium longisporum TaxID=46187 RepID=A0ABP6L6F3_9ACTN
MSKDTPAAPTLAALAREREESPGDPSDRFRPVGGGRGLPLSTGCPDPSWVQPPARKECPASTDCRSCAWLYGRA